MKIIVSITVVIISFLSGHYLSTYASHKNLAEMQQIKDIVITGLEDVETKRKADKLIETLAVQSKITDSLINIEESGKPIKIAIKDSLRTLSYAIDNSSTFINDIKNDEEKARVNLLMNNAQKKLDDNTFYYGK